MDIPAILESKYPGLRWELNGDTYEGLNWLDNSTKPTEEELQELWLEVQEELKAKAQAQIDAKASAIAKLKALGLTIEEVGAAFGLAE
jgi:hypothetical protein